MEDKLENALQFYSQKHQVPTIDKNITQNQENVNQVYRAYMMMLLQMQIKDIKLLPMLD